MSRARLVLLIVMVAAAACSRTQERDRYQAVDSVRHQQRAYEGAPPVIRHEVEALGRDDCLACHELGTALVAEGKRRAPLTPHPQYMNCRQCHIEQRATDVFRASTFEGLQPGGVVPRAQPLGPPYIPHRLQDRPDCRACHLGLSAPSELVPAHGDRVNCVQCHLQLQRAVPPFVSVASIN